MSVPQDPIAESAGRAPRAYRFGAFELRPASRQLLRDGAAVAVQPRVFDLIAYLLSHRDRAVDKNELLEAVWPRRVVTDAALSRCVMKARRALDDDSETPRMILTVHGRGLRFVSAVTQVFDRAAPREPEAAIVHDEDPGRSPPAIEAMASGAPESAMADAAPTAAPVPATPLTRRPWFWAATVTLALLLALAMGWRLQHQADRVNATGPLRVAVLPVDNATGEVRYDWARLGLMSALDDILRADGSVWVLSAHDVIDMAGQASDQARLVRRLRAAYGISHVVAGQLQRHPGQLRFDYRVIDAAGHVRPRTVVAQDVPGLAHAAGADLRIALGLAGSPPRVSADAFANEAFLRGRALQLQGDVAGAQAYFELAGQQAPEAFWPRYEYALGLRDLGQRDEAERRLRALLREADAGSDLRARLAARNALAIMAWRSGDKAQAARLLDESRGLAETLGAPALMATILTNLGILATQRDDFDAARGYLNRAAEIELAAGQDKPSGNVLHSLAMVDLGAGDVDAAGLHLEAALAQFRLVGNRRDEAITLNSLAGLRFRQGDVAAARDRYRQALDRQRALGNRSAESSALLGLAGSEAELGRLREARAQAERGLAVAEAIGEQPKVADARSLLGRIARNGGELAVARRWQAQARSDLLALGDDDGVWRERLLLARIDLADGQATAAAREAETVAAEAASGQAELRRIDALALAAEARLALDEPDAADARLGEALTIAADLRDARRTATLRRLLAEARLATGDDDGAATELAAAEAWIGTTPEFLRVRAQLAAARGDAKAALADEQAAKAAAGERWRDADEARLASRRAAAG
jgi:DNA-binding winged helix-turn-helix (wHTH) protein/TolB-like protein